MNDSVLATLRCPVTGQPLTFHDGSEPYLQTADGSYRYQVVDGIAMLLAEEAIKVDSANTQA